MSLMKRFRAQAQYEPKEWETVARVIDAFEFKHYLASVMQTMDAVA